MNANNILTNITRYIHAKYDHETNHNAVDLPLLLKRSVEKFDDDILYEYWNEYLKPLEFKHRKCLILSVRK